jgi:hypothetical protein
MFVLDDALNNMKLKGWSIVSKMNLPVPPFNRIANLTVYVLLLYCRIRPLMMVVLPLRCNSTASVRRSACGWNVKNASGRVAVMYIRLTSVSVSVPADVFPGVAA